MNRKLLIPSLVLFSAITPGLRGAIVFEDDFSTGDLTVWDNIDTGGANVDVGVIADGGNLFGAGTDNSVANFIDEDSGDTVFIGAGAALTNVATFQFDFVDTGTSRGVAFRLDQSASGVSTDDYVQVIVQEESLNIRSGATNATFGSYVRGEEYKLTIVANNSGSTITDYFDGNDLANDSYAVWLTPVGAPSSLILNATFELTSDSSDFTSIAAQTFSGATGVNMLIDNVEAFSGVETSALAIPEPSTYVLLAGLGALALVAARRRARA